MPSTPKLIAAQQMQFIGKVVRGYFDQPPMMMPTAWCNRKRKAGGPNKTKKDFVVKHLRLLLARIHEVNIDHFGSLEDWINEANDKAHWDQLIKCLLHPSEELAEKSESWNRRQHSQRN